MTNLDRSIEDVSSALAQISIVARLGKRNSCVLFHIPPDLSHSRFIVTNPSMANCKSSKEHRQTNPERLIRAYINEDDSGLVLATIRITLDLRYGS